MTVTPRRIAAVCTLLVLLIIGAAASRQDSWTASEIAQLGTMSLSELEPPEPDPSNRVADEPRAVEFGHQLFFDTRLSSNGRVACATCHVPDREFQDDVPLATGVGTTRRRTMPIMATAHSPFLFWDGRKDSLWAQALGPLENAEEHGGTRAQYAHVVAEHYRPEYEGLFGPLPNLSGIPRVAGPVDDPGARLAWARLTSSERDAVTAVYVNIGKAIGAYERGITYLPSRFDRYVDALRATGRVPAGVLTQDEVAGLRLFVGKANCTQCHNGPLLTNNEFHNTGVPARAGLPPDSGRAAGVTSVLEDEFNCRSRWSDARSNQCAELSFLVSDSPVLERAFKVPSLRGVADRAPYMHAGQLLTLADVLDHYNQAPEAPAGRTELKPLNLNNQQLRQLEMFLRSLSGGTVAPLEQRR